MSPFAYGDGGVASVNSLGVPVTLGTALAVGSDEVATGASAAQTGAVSIARIASSASSTYPTLIKATAGRLYGYEVLNLSTVSAQYVKLHDSNVTPTAATAVMYSIGVPCGQSNLSLIAPARMWFDQGLSFSSGLGFRMTRGGADTNDQSVGTAEIFAHIFYK